MSQDQQASPRNLLEMHIFGPAPNAVNGKPWGCGPAKWLSWLHKCENHRPTALHSAGAVTTGGLGSVPGGFPFFPAHSTFLCLIPSPWPINTLTLQVLGNSLLPTPAGEQPTWQWHTDAGSPGPVRTPALSLTSHRTSARDCSSLPYYFTSRTQKAILISRGCQGD